MRLYPYALPLTLLLALPACGDDKGTTATDTSSATDTSTGTTGTTAEATTDQPTGTGTDATSTTGTSTSTATATTDATGTSTTDATGTSTTDATSTGTTGGPLVGDPSTYGEACAPDDGPATEFKIKLAERLCDATWAEDVPIFRIVLFQGVDLPVGDYPLDGGWGFVYYDIGDGNPKDAKGGTFSITEVTADGLRGAYDITLIDDTQLSGQFDALYCPVDVLCG